MKVMKVRHLAALTAAILACAPAVAAAAPGSGRGITLDWAEVLATGVYGIMGIVLAIAGYFLFELVTPFSVKKELTEDDNLAMGVVVGAMFLGVSIIVAAAIL
jgi:thiol:disulfide interchange protein